VSGITLERRLANFRSLSRATDSTFADRRRSEGLAERLAAAVDGEVIRGRLGSVVRCEPLTVILPVDRERLWRLPGQPPADVPLVCLDTETTGLATAAGTLCFLVGLGWWQGDRFKQAQLLLPDQPDEPALLELLTGHIPDDGWLVTYNGRGFDWPLLVARYRMARHDPPPHAGHLDLLPFVRRVFRHRMADARLATVESELLGVTRHGDLDGWEIPGRYLDFLRFGEAGPLVDVVRHNREDVRSLARLLAHVEAGLADAAVRGRAHRGDLAGLARAFSRERRLDEALECLDTALAAEPAATSPPSAGARPDPEDDGWWMPRRPVDFGGRPRRRSPAALPPRLDSPWTEERILVERARLLRRLARYREAATAWEALAGGTGPLSAIAWIEVAKLREHRFGDLPGALVAADNARTVSDRRRRLGRIDPALDRALARRLGRLIRRLEAVGSAGRRHQAVTTDAAGGTMGTRGSAGIDAQASRTQSRSGSNEQAIVRRSPASAFR
jgi:hypothetical protein